MKKMISKAFMATIIAGASVFASCKPYDDTALSTRVDNVEKEVTELRTIVDGLNVNIKALLTTVDAVKNADRITNVSELADKSGYTVTFSKSGTITIYNGKNGIDGTDGKNGTDGKTPLISVKLDADGTYYWTVNGEYLLDDDGKKIAATAHIATPQIRINAGNFEISYNNGATWEVIGSAGASDAVVFKKVVDSESSVLFVLADGTSITIPKAQQFIINVPTTVIIKAGETATAQYSIIAGDNQTVVDAFGTKGFDVTVNAANANNGMLIIKAPDPLTNGKVYIFAVKGDGSTAARILSCEEGVFTIDETPFGAHVPAAGGEVRIPVSTNIDYMAMVDPAYGWIKLLETRAVRNETLTFTVEPNTSSDPREGKVIVMNPVTGRKIYTIVQDGATAAPGGGKADLETFNGGNKALTINTYESANGWTATLSVIFNVSFRFPEYSGVRPRLSGEPGALGTLISPVLSGGCGKLTVKYARYTINNGNTMRIDITDAGGSVIKTETHTNDTIGQYETDEFSIDFNVTGDFKIILSNLNYHNTITISDEITILDLTWTGYSH